MRRQKKAVWKSSTVKGLKKNYTENEWWKRFIPSTSHDIKSDTLSSTSSLSCQSVILIGKNLISISDSTNAGAYFDQVTETNIHNHHPFQTIYSNSSKVNFFTCLVTIFVSFLWEKKVLQLSILLHNWTCWLKYMKIPWMINFIIFKHCQKHSQQQ